MEEHRDTGRIFDNAENDNQYTARKSRWNGRLSGKNSRSYIGLNRCYIKYEQKKYIYIYINKSEYY